MSNPISEKELEQLVLAHFWGEDWKGDYPDMERIRLAQPEDYQDIMELQTLCRRYAAAELRAAAGNDENFPNADPEYVPDLLVTVAETRNSFRRTLRERVSELEQL